MYHPIMTNPETDTLRWWASGVIGPRHEDDRRRRALRPSPTDPTWRFTNTRELAVVIDVPGYSPKLLKPGGIFEFQADGWYTLAVGDPDHHRGTLAVGNVARLAAQIY